MSRSAVNIRKVAEEAGVSVATVSRVLRGNAPVAEVTRQRVHAASAELRYKPNLRARAFAEQRHSKLGAEQAAFPIAPLCRVPGGALSDTALTDWIRRVHRGSSATYGAPRIHAALQSEGVRCGRKQVARPMRAAGLAGGRRPRTAIADLARRRAEPNRPQFSGGGAESALGRRPDRRPDQRGVALPGRAARCLFAAGRRLGDG